jgi:protease-4
MRKRACLLASFVSCFALAALLSRVAAAEPPVSMTEGVPSPSRSVASSDDASAISVNPANLAFLPGAEARWTWVRTGAASPFPNRGHSLDLAVPLWAFATGLRFDWLDPPSAAPAPYDESYRWVRWGLAFHFHHAVSYGLTLGWSSSDAPALDDAFSLTGGVTVRPSPYVSLSAVARDFNTPETRTRAAIEPSYDFGLALRPAGGRRDVEVGLEATYFEEGDAWAPKATASVDVPRIGTLRGEVTAFDVDDDPSVRAMLGLDVDLNALELSGGGVFGDALSRSGAGFYAGAALRAYREPGVRLPARVARIRIDSTPGVRGHTRLLRKLWRLARDSEVSGVLLVLRDEPASSLAHGEELGDAIRGLRAAGKKVMCHLEDAGGQSLFACSQADRIAMNPAGGLRFAGISKRYFYFGGLLEKLGVRADFVRIGAHKGAAEQFTNERGSDVAREDHQVLVDEYERIFLHEIGGGRRIPARVLAERIARGPFLASEAREAGLIDDVAYDDELDRWVEDVMGGPVRVSDEEPLPTAPERWGDAPKIALVYLSGDMVDGESQSIPFVGVRLAGSVTIGRALRRAREDSSVRAVVFRVETGGGSSLAADVILREAMLTAKAKPLIVSMGSAAASGGYYASVAAKPIFANRGTMTGSIGIFYGKVDVVGLLGKLGVGTEGHRSAPRADAESIFRPFTDDERQELGRKVKQFYDLFIGRVSEGRGMRPEQVDAVARGQVWTGAQALPRGLVDRLGGLREALAEARARGGLPPDAPIVESPDDDESLLATLVKLAGVSAAGAPVPFGELVVPPALLDVARALSPFLVYEPTKPLARVEFVENTTFGKSATVREP